MPSDLSSSPLSDVHSSLQPSLSTFFSHHTPPPDLHTLSLHDALPISARTSYASKGSPAFRRRSPSSWARSSLLLDRKTRLNSSHSSISYAVFCLKKKKKINI